MNLKLTIVAGILLTLSTATHAAFLGPEKVMPLTDSSLLVALTRTKEIAVYDIDAKKTVRRIPLGAEPNDLIVRDNIGIAAVGNVHGKILFFNPLDGKIVKSLEAGHSPRALTLSNDAKTLFWADRFSHQVNRLDIASGHVDSAPTGREPYALALSCDGSHLFAANLLPEDRSDSDLVSAQIDVFRTQPFQHVTRIRMPNGSQSLRDMTLVPDGGWLAVTHVLSRFQIPATQIDRGWINANAVSFVNTATFRCDTTVLLDDVDMGFANPWGVIFPDSATLCIVSAGLHQVSIIDWHGLQKRLHVEPTDRLSALHGIRSRLTLGLNGARTLTPHAGKIWTAGVFSDELTAVDPRTGRMETFPLGGSGVTTPAELGERYFNDATYCFQGWQSCISCHPDARVDALNWDLMNDGIGNPKNTRSMLFSHQLSPSMWLGIRKSAKIAVRAGFKHIQFAEPPEDVACAVDSYLSSLRPLPGPALDRKVPEKIKKANDKSCIQCHGTDLQRGSLTASARRGKAIFKGKANCVSCHPHPYFTNGKMVDAGLTAGMDSGRPVKVPSLNELWRTAPYLHDGRAATLRDAIILWNANGKRGNTADLTEAEINDLLQYLLSL